MTDPILVAGGAGFIGSHLCEALLRTGHEVLCVDNLCTGRESNIQPLYDYPGFTFIEHDIIGGASGPARASHRSSTWRARRALPATAACPSRRCA